MRIRRLLCLLIAFCLIFTQTAQAYSLARLPYNYQHTTSKARTDGTNQSYNRSSLTSNSGNLNIMAGGNIIASGTDLAANKGDLALTAGGTVALLAGQDTLSQESSTLVVTNPNFFTKQRHTITDSYSSLDYQGSTVQGKSVKVSGGGDIVLQAADVKAGEGGINLDAGNDIKLLAAVNSTSRTHTEKLSTDGMLLQADGVIDYTADRRKNNKAESQTQTAQVTSLTSAGNITTHSGRDTLIEASTLDAKGSIDLTAGNDATYNEDGSIKTKGTEGKLTFAAVKDSTYNNVDNSSNSMVWQASSGHGDYKETVKLANISAGKGLSVSATGGIVVDIPEVPKEAPAPVEAVKEEPIPTTGPDGKPLTEQQKAAYAAEKAAKAAKAAEEKKIRDEQRFNDHIQNLAGKPGQEWIGQLAKMAKDKPDQVKLQQVNAAMQHWDYAHEGLTSEAVAVIAIVVTYFTAGAASGAAGSMVASAGATAGTATATIATAAIAAGITTLASQATIALINNKGDLGKTLDDMGKSENVKALVSAMLTAGVLAQLGQTIHIGNNNLNSINAKSPFIDQLQKNVINQSTSAVINHAMYGGDLQQQLEQSLKNAFIDTGAAQGANLIGNLHDKGTLNDITHKLAHAVAGCAAGAAKAGDCGSGALGAVVGEIAAELYTPADASGLTPRQLQNMQGDIVNFSKMMAGVAAAITGQDVNLAAGAGANAAENNYLSHWQQATFDKEMKACSSAVCKIGTMMRWGGTSVKQDAAMVSGMALGATFEVKDIATALLELPGTLHEIANNPALLKQLPDGYVKDLQTTYDEYQTALEAAGADGATAAGVKLTHLLTQLSLLPAAAATGGAALALTGEKVVSVLGKVGKGIVGGIEDAAMANLAPGAIHGFRSADEINALMRANDWSPAWKSGSQIAEVTVAPGTKVQMVVGAEDYAKLMDPTADISRSFGGWATFDHVPDQAYARNQLAITSEMKPNAGYVIEVEITQPINAQVGVVGAQGAATGGGSQLHFVIPPQQRINAFKVVGGRALP